MAKFQFIALDNAGKERRGMVEAPNKELAATQIKGYGLLPARISPVKLGKRGVDGRGYSLDGVGGSPAAVKRPMYFGAAIGQKGLSVFTRQLGTLLQAGLSLLRSLETLMAQEPNPAFKWVLSQQADNIRSGNPFSEGLSRFPKEFDQLYINMVKAGEASGTLDKALDRLANYLMKVREIRQKVVSASLYPIVVFTVSLFIVLLLMTFIVPKFEEIFAKQMGGQELPRLTQFVLWCSNQVTANWMLWLGGAGLLAIFVMLAKSTEAGRSVASFLKLHTPIFSDTFRKIYISRFCRTFGTLLESGVPILEALRFSRDAVDNKVFSRAIDKVHSRVKDGESLARPIMATGLFPPMVTSMIEVGEETGDMPLMLNQIADIYDHEVDSSVAALTSVIEPILIVCLALFVLLVAVALFLPFISIMQGIGR